MKTTHFFKVLWATVLSLSLLMLTSCTKDDPEPEPNPHTDAFADVFVKKVATPQGDKYGLVFYAGGEGLTSCQAKAPDGTMYELEEFWKGPGNMRRHPKNNEMQGMMPDNGNYIFTMTFDDGETKTLEDVLTNVEIPAINGVEILHTSGTEEVTANWPTVEGTDNYMVKLTDEFKNKNKPLFNNKMLTIDDNTYTFDKSTEATPGWMQEGVPVFGDTCYVMVVAIKYEEGVSGPEKHHNKQISTVKPTMITW